MIDFFDLNCFLLDPERQLPKEASKDHVRTWLEYKTRKGVEDPDSSDGARYFYKELWGERLGITVRECRNKFSRKPSMYVQGDWMCSVTTTFGKGLSLFVHENDDLQEPFSEKFPDTTLRGGVGGYNTYAPILLKDMADKQDFRKFWEDEALQEFIRSAYTSANLIIVPDGFNSARLKHTGDYWDRTLEYYFEYFNPEDPRIYKNCDVGTPFHTLVEKSREHGDELFLNEWLDQENKPKMLPNTDPASMEEWRELMREMTRRIDRRRDQMAQYIGQLQN